MAHGLGSIAEEQIMIKGWEIMIKGQYSEQLFVQMYKVKNGS